MGMLGLSPLSRRVKMQNIFKTKWGWKYGEELTFSEVYDLENKELYRWCLNNSPGSCKFDILESMLIAMRFELFVLMINSHFKN